jgi:hypothetical protein
MGFALLACSPQTDLQQESSSQGTGGASAGGATGVAAGRLVEPPPGSTSIPGNLSSLTLEFGEAVAQAGPGPAFELRPASGSSTAAQLVGITPCTGTCYALRPDGTLAPSTLYTLDILPGQLQFLDGKPVPAASLGAFTTADAPDLFAPRIQAFTVRWAEGCLTVHLVSDEPTRAVVSLSAGDSQPTLCPELRSALHSDGLAVTLDFAERLPKLPTSTRVQVVASVEDRAGNPTVSAPLGLDLPPALPYLVITELLANPAGSETTQEFVEIYNADSQPVALGGLLLADKAGSDVLPEVILPAGSYGLLVPEKFNAAEGKDTPPRDGTLLVPVAGRLAGDGLGNAGEVVQLLTTEGYVVSQYGGWVDVSASAWSGKSVKRSAFDACDGADAWGKTPSPATPGW